MCNASSKTPWNILFTNYLRVHRWGRKKQRICREELEKKNKRVKREEQVNLSVLRMVKINTEVLGKWNKPVDTGERITVTRLESRKKRKTEVTNSVGELEGNIGN